MEATGKAREHRKKRTSSSMDDLNQDVLEQVLSWLPTSSFLRLSNSVSKRWKSTATSPTFKLACSNVPSRDPWFLMLSDNNNSNLTQTAVAFDTSENRYLRLPNLSKTSVPITSSKGLICHHNSSLGTLTISNPITGDSSLTPPLHPKTLQTLRAVAFTKSSNKLALVFGESPNLLFKLYDPKAGQWDPDIPLRHDHGINKYEEERSVYFLSKAGNVVSVSPGMQTSPCKRFPSAAGERDGEEYVYFLSPSGRLTACNLTRRRVSEYPRLLPALRECSLDVVEREGRPLVVLLSEFCESAGLRVWGFDDVAGEWRQTAAMPAAMSHEWYGKRADVNCAAFGNRLLVCLSSALAFACVLCDLDTNVWTLMPRSSLAGAFVSALSFEPRLEACV